MSIYADFLKTTVNFCGYNDKTAVYEGIFNQQKFTLKVEHNNIKPDSQTIAEIVGELDEASAIDLFYGFTVNNCTIEEAI